MFVKVSCIRLCYCTFKTIIQVPSQTVNLFRIIDSQWAQTGSCYIAAGITPEFTSRVSGTARQPTLWMCCCVLKGLDGGNSLFHPLSLFPTPHYCLCCPSSPADGEDLCHVTIERDTKCTKCFFHPLLLSMQTLVSGGRGERGANIPSIDPPGCGMCAKLHLFTAQTTKHVSTVMSWLYWRLAKQCIC